MKKTKIIRLLICHLKMQGYLIIASNSTNKYILQNKFGTMSVYIHGKILDTELPRNIVYIRKDTDMELIQITINKQTIKNMLKIIASITTENTQA